MQARTLFLIDGLGACLTAFLLKAVVGRFEEIFGMPDMVVSVLFVVAVIFAIHSMSCYFFIRKKEHVFLKTIAIANLIYCCLTFTLIIFFYSRITIIGWMYFAGELIIIAGLSVIELKLGSRKLENT